MRERQESKDVSEESAAAERAPGDETERADQAIAGEVSAALIQRKFSGGGGGGAGESAGGLGTEGAGREVPFRAEMEQAFSADFSGVRAYTGRSQEMAALGAKAATRGEDGKVAFADQSPDRQTVAHELAHVEQARNAGASGVSTRSSGVSRPEEPAEREADAAAGVVAAGGKLEPGALRTRAEGIQRFGAEEGGGESRSVAEVVAESVAQTTPGAYEFLVFLHAVAGGDKAGALAAWEAVPAATRQLLDAPMILAELEAYPPAPADPMMSLPAEESICLPQEKVRYPASLGDDPVASVLRVLGPDAIGVLAAADVLLTEPRHSEIVLQDHANAAAWVAALTARPGIFITFVMFGLPTAETVTPEQARQMAAFADAMDGIYPEMLFQRIYPPLEDTSYDSDRVLCRPWGPDDVKRMFSGLTDNGIPPAHVHTIASGFYLGTHKVKEDGNVELGYGWYTSDDEVVMPAGPNYTGTGTGHGMSGGASATTGRHLDHFDSTLLHEVGHGVGDHSDGNQWAKEWGDWKKHGLGEWSEQLFDDSAAEAVGDALVDSGVEARINILRPESARRWMAKKIAGRDPGTVISFGDSILDLREWTEAEVEDFIRTHYGAEPLTKYYLRFMNQLGADPDNAYKVNDDNRGADGRIYMFLDVWDDSHCSYEAKVYDQQISRYSLCSYGEWFAEQYTEYYRTNKTGNTLPDQVKQKLDELDAMKWDEDQERLKTPGGADDSTPMKQYTDEERLMEYNVLFRWWFQ